MQAASEFLTGQEANKPNFRNSTGAFPAGIVGAGGSSSLIASRVPGLCHIPQVPQIAVLGTHL